MGKISDRFGELKYNNEAEVSQNFVFPLLTEFFGYNQDEIIPERHFRLFKIPLNRDTSVDSKQVGQKPDYIVCIDGNQDAPRFTLDSKGPNEKLDDHFSQLISYMIGTKTNLLVITNGSALQVFYGNELVFDATNIEDLDLKWNVLEDILSRDVQLEKSPIEIIRDIDIDKALGESAKKIVDKKLRMRKVRISDFNSYLNTMLKEFEEWHYPSELTSFLGNIIERFPRTLVRGGLFLSLPGGLGG